MRKLFDQFEQLSTEAQALLEKGISQMRMDSRLPLHCARR